MKKLLNEITKILNMFSKNLVCLKWNEWHNEFIMSSSINDWLADPYMRIIFPQCKGHPKMFITPLHDMKLRKKS